MTTATAIVFDLDGTLIDSAPDLAAALQQVLAARGAAPIDLTTVRRFIGNGVPKLVERGLTHRGLPASGSALDSAVQDFLTHYAAAPVARTRVFDGAGAAVEALATDHPLAICTNKPAGPTRAILAHFGLHRVFQAVVGGDSLPTRKPDPAMLESAVDGTGAAQAIFVGDSEVDAETASRAGIPFALFTGGYRKSAVADIPHAAAFDHYRTLAATIAAIRAQTAEN